MDRILSSIEDILLNRSYKYDFDVIKDVYCYVIDSNSNSSAMRYFFEHMTLLGKSVDPEDENSVQQFATYYEKYNSLINGIITRLVHYNTDEDTFYQKLWNTIENGELVDNNTMDKIYVWLFVWRNKYIPYFHLDNGMKMSNEEFRSLSNQLFLKISKISFILHSDFDQKTERSSLLVSVLDSCNNTEEKCVLMSQLLNMTRINQLNAEDIRQLKKLLGKDDES